MTTNIHSTKTLICDFCLTALPPGDDFYSPRLSDTKYAEYYEVTWRQPEDKTLRMDSCVECQKALKEFISARRAPALKNCGLKEKGVVVND